MRVTGKKYSRRKFLYHTIQSGAVITGGGFWYSCQSPKKDKEENEAVTDCGDYSQISEEEIAKRDALGYVAETPIDENKCDNCQLYLPPKPGENCGGCQLFKGPVFSEAYCTYWAPQV